MDMTHEKILIVGSGVFGLSLAYELSQRGYRNVCVLDRYLPPVPDGSSVDISRVIRPDYADPLYAAMGLEAMEGWRTEYSPFYHESGLMVLSETQKHPYIEQSAKNLEALGQPVQLVTDAVISQRYPAINGDVAHLSGYLNQKCGWAVAHESVVYLARKCSEAGVSFITGPQGTLTSLITSKPKRRAVAVATRANTTITADRIVLATGAWSASLLDMSYSSVSTGQPVAFLQLTPEEAESMQSCPVVINLSTGWFAFPPTPGTNILKLARHGYGYESRKPSNLSDQSLVSGPLCENNNAESTFIPEDADRALRDGLRMFFPLLSERPFQRRRLCWYTDTSTGDFIVDYHSMYSNLFVASGGSGHAFKFLPVLGRYLADGFEGKASAEQKQKWAWRPSSAPISKGDGSRGGPLRRVLSSEEQTCLFQSSLLFKDLPSADKCLTSRL